MAETYRKSKIEHYLERLQVRKRSLMSQLEMTELKQSREFICGQLSATDLIIMEITVEFGLADINDEGGEAIDGECGSKQQNT
ncbi:hypothetical protein [Paenibacillus piri]|uniref:Uncharacterized protein n=1 Tax=Paenibacillus piri TaxID=2547395 RepID=A0A4R5KYZ5_9BACL|nr:hypothetical protein [Paenibacillus piri]TDG00378.1 hypothetical protein E1757_01705 [Paenibacillus piri]